MRNSIRELRKQHTVNIAIPEPFDFQLTVRKPAGWTWATPGELYENGTLWTAIS